MWAYLALRLPVFLLTIMSSEEHSETNRITKMAGSFKELASLHLSRASIEMDSSSDNLNPTTRVAEVFSSTFL